MMEKFMMDYYREHYDGFPESLKDDRYRALEAKIADCEALLVQAVDRETAEMLTTAVLLQLKGNR